MDKKDLSLGLKLITSLHVKLIDKHQYFHFTSSHPNYTNHSVVSSQALRVISICASESDFRKHISEMKTWFLIRGYTKNVVEPEIKKVKFSHVCNSKSQKRTLKRIPLVAT